jgi:hypothetical protein
MTPFEYKAARELRGSQTAACSNLLAFTLKFFRRK